MLFLSLADLNRYNISKFDVLLLIEAVVLINPNMRVADILNLIKNLKSK